MFTLHSVAGGVCAPQGFFADGISAGLKPDNQKDLAFIYSDHWLTFVQFSHPTAFKLLPSNTLKNMRFNRPTLF